MQFGDAPDQVEPEAGTGNVGTVLAAHVAVKKLLAQRRRDALAVVANPDQHGAGLHQHGDLDRPVRRRIGQGIADQVLDGDGDQFPVGVDHDRRRRTHRNPLRRLEIGNQAGNQRNQVETLRAQHQRRTVEPVLVQEAFTEGAQPLDATADPVEPAADFGRPGIDQMAQGLRRAVDHRQRRLDFMREHRHQAPLLLPRTALGQGPLLGQRQLRRIQLAPVMLAIEQGQHQHQAKRQHFPEQPVVALLQTQLPNIAILDIGLPDEDGLDIASRLRSRHPEIGIVMLTARTTLNDRIEGHLRGADNYLCKPIEMSELVAVVQARARAIEASRRIAGQWRFAPAELALYLPNGERLPLTAAEHLVLSTLLQQPQQQADRDLLVKALGGRPEDYDIRRLEVTISRLRQKIRAVSPDTNPIRALRNRGYAFLYPVRYE